MKNHTLVLSAMLALTLQACGSSKPAVSDVEPAVMDLLGQCPLWSVSDLEKTDGIPGAASYRLDFKAKLVLKQSAPDTSRLLVEHQTEPAYLSCHYLLQNLISVEGRMVKLSLKYEVAGAADLVKSEKGWRVSGQLHDFDYTPLTPALDANPPPSQPSASAATSAVALPEANAQEASSGTQVPQSKSSTCVEREMGQWRQQHEKDLDEAGKAARAKGEELQTSAGEEALLEQEALTNATGACGGR